MTEAPPITIAVLDLSRITSMEYSEVMTKAIEYGLEHVFGYYHETYSLKCQLSPDMSKAMKIGPSAISAGFHEFLTRALSDKEAILEVYPHGQ